MTYQITLSVKPDPAEVQILDDGLTELENDIFGSTDLNGAAYFLRDDSGRVVGGVYGYIGSFGWLYISKLWVAKELRGFGHGRQLMERIEAFALENNCGNAFLDTFSYQAPEFYKKLGYTVFGELENFPAGHSRIFLRKKIT